MKDNLKRSNSAEFRRKSDNYYKTKVKHKKMSNIAKKKLTELNKEKKTQDNIIDSGGFNNVINAGDGVVIRQGKKEDNNEKEDNNKKFNTLFTWSLLKACGEPTITIGSMNNNSGDDLFYMDQAKGSLQTLFDKIFEKIKKNANVNDFSDNEKQIICLFYLLRLLNSSALSLTETNAIIDATAIFDETLENLFLAFHPEEKSFKREYLAPEDWKKFFTTQNIEIIARHLCKVFLLYMFDRKPANLLVFDNKQKSKQEFVEADFDDLKVINCLFGKITDGYDKELFSYKIESIFFRFYILTKFMPESKYDEFSDCIKRIAKKFTFKQTDIEQLILDIAQNKKYFNISDDELVNGIKNKFKDWKDMLEKNYLKEKYNKFKGDNNPLGKSFVDRINPFFEAIKTTYDTLLKFDEQRISKLVELQDRWEEFDKNIEDNKKGDKKNSKAQSVKIKRQTPEVLIKGRNNNNTSADCNLQDYIPSCIKECFDCA